MKIWKRLLMAVWSLCDLVIYRIGGRERSGEDRTCKAEI